MNDMQTLLLLLLLLLFFQELINAFFMLLFLLFSFLFRDHIFPQSMKVSFALCEYRVEWERQKK